MKNSIIFIGLTLLLTACGASRRAAKEVAQAPQTVIEEKVTIPAEKEAPETPEIPEVPEPPAKEEIEEEIEETVIPLLKDEDHVDIPSAPVYTNHTSYNDLLKQYVTPEGNVNYDGFKSNWKTLRDYIAVLAERTPDDSWPLEEQLAYWMNAYNALTVDLILRHYPLSSIKDIKDPWGQRFWKLGGKWINLNEIEHEILRKKGDPRIHFGINCASFSCPPLLNEAFTAQKVDAQLDDLARRFINDSQRNIITANNIEISKIFSWFAKDFKTDGSIIDFLNKYSEVTITSKAKRKFKDYDWTLNK